jgi:aminoglycoside phosphotransferase (APT) family kinase protein
MSIDPADDGAVHDALLSYARNRLGPAVDFTQAPTTLGRGFDTFIYAFQIHGSQVDADWAGPLVLRIYSSPDQGPKSEREGEIQGFTAGLGYRSVAPLAVEPTGTAFGLPIMIMPRVDGGTLLESVTKKPWRARRLLRGMADLHAALHSLSTDGCPLPYDKPRVDTVLGDIRERIDGMGAAHMDEGYRWLDARKSMVSQEEPVLCHNDFHPLNVLVDSKDSMAVIDWSDAALGDRHCDVARTVAVIWFAQIAATSAVERAVLKAARGFLRGSYFNRYNELLPVDGKRLAYWEALHTFGGWSQLEEVSVRSARGEHQTDMAQQIPAGTLELARDRFWVLTRAI